MIRRAVLLASFLQFALGSFGQVSGVQHRPLSGTEAAVPQVLEAGAKATHEKDTIRGTLQLTAALGPGG